MTTSTYDKQALDFLARFVIRFAYKKLGYIAPPWKESVKDIRGDKYTITLSKGERGVDYQEISFPFWNSYHAMQTGEELTAYAVLACLSGDLYCPDTFHDFCAEYGHNEDSRKAEATFKRVRTFSGKLNAFFTEEEKEALAEIQ